MPQDSSADELTIREWLAKEPNLPNDIDDLMIRKFLHSCYGSLEQTKKCIERFTTTRTTMSEIYTDRDPLSPKLQTAFNITNVGTFKIDGDAELLIHQLDDPTLENFSFYDCVKVFTMQADQWLMTQDLLASRHIIVLDIKDYTLKILTKVNILFFKDFLIYLLEGMPVRVKEVYVINAPSYYEKLYALVKPVLPAEICNIIKFYHSGEELQQSIDKKFLPKEYGGENGSLKEVHREWVKKVEDNRNMFLDENLWKATPKKKTKGNVVDTTMEGSFKSLSID